MEPGRSLVAPGLLLALAIWPGATAPAVSSPAAETDEGPELVGLLSREEIEAALPDWVEEEIAAAPDPAASARLAGELPGARLVVYLGTWCSDSRRELARFWRALDEAAAPGGLDVTYIGVDRAKLEPSERLSGIDLRFVPTFVVLRGGRELGRVVEESPRGIEHDLLALLAGERQGLITANRELLEEQEAH